MNIKGAIFDMDGTLVDSLSFWETLWKTLGKEFLGNDSFLPTAEDDKAVRTMPLKDAMQLIHDNYSIGKDGAELLDFTDKLLVDFYKTDVKVKSGTYEFLEHLRKNDVKMCIASATAPHLVEIALDACNLRKYFLKFFSCAELNIGKDKPDIFNIALDFLGTKKSDTWVFEDSLVAVDTAAKAGFPTVGIFDKNNIGSNNLKNTADIFIAEGETLQKLI